MTLLAVCLFVIAADRETFPPRPDSVPERSSQIDARRR
ncbi:hypothetical protein GLA29479_694 [Lysobacter antibioticus]|nr:hypothetical protein GLA29479_694 [Lysobacter antibioticus]